MEQITRMRKTLSIVLLLVASAAAFGEEAVSAKQTTSGATKKSRVPVVVHSRFECKELSNEQYEMLVAEAIEENPIEQELWFIKLTRNYRERVVATVYFKPEESTESLRKGRYFVRDELYEVSKAFRERAKDGGIIPRELPLYCQVSLKNKLFKKDQTETPTGTLLPFPLPSNIKDEELVELVDFVRSSPARNGPARGTLELVYGPDGGQIIGVQPAREKVTGPEDTAPFVSIELKDSEFEVLMGHHEGPMSGIGNMLTIKRTDEAFVVVGAGEWVF